MWSLIERWRGKSREARSHIAVVIASVATGVIALVWLVSLPARFAETSEQAASAIGGAREESADSSVGAALQDLVTTAEALRGQGLPQAGTSTEEYAPTQAIPRRVLIATSTATGTGEMSP